MTHARKLVAIASAIAVVGFSAGAVDAQSGHFIKSGKNAPTCTDIGTQVTCDGKVAGLGGTTFEITIEADGVAIIECENPGGNVAPGQDTDLEVAGSTGPQATPRNGQSLFSVTTDEPPPVPNFPTCPNPKWTAHVVDVIFSNATLSLFEDNVLVDQVVVPVS